MFRTITAKYRGICKRCNGPIAIGDRIRYGGAGRSYHFAAECGDASDRSVRNEADVDTMADTIAADITREYFGADR